MHKEDIYNGFIPKWSSLCQVCENVVMLCIGINEVANKEKQTTENPHDVVENFGCNSDFLESMQSKCSPCTNSNLTSSDFQIILSPVMIAHKLIINLLTTGLSITNINF